MAQLQSLQHKTLERLQQRIDQLPLLPGVVVSLMNLDPQSDGYYDEVSSLLHSDPAFATKLLRYANSVAISPPHPVTSLERALQLVGCKSAVELMFVNSATKVFVPHNEWERNLWRHALDVACLMRAMAQRVTDATLDAEKAYLFGLLHDIGRFVLYLESPEELRLVDETAWDTPQALIDAEMSICGFTHAELGYLALSKWDMPRVLAKMIRYHHQPDMGVGELDPADVLLIRLLQDVDWISVKFGVGSGRWRTMTDEQQQAVLLPARMKSKLRIKSTDLAVAMQKAFIESEEVQRTLGIVSHPEAAPGAAAPRR